jgi:hypothetical protein
MRIIRFMPLAYSISSTDFSSASFSSASQINLDDSYRQVEPNGDKPEHQSSRLLYLEEAFRDLFSDT